MVVSRLRALEPYFLDLLRIMTALIFLEHGSSKLLGFPIVPKVPELYTLGWWSGVLELVGGALLVLGFLTRPVAFLLSGEMAFAYFLSHAPRSFYPVLNGGDAAILYCFVFLYLAVAGAGPFSVDAARTSPAEKRRASVPSFQS